MINSLNQINSQIANITNQLSSLGFSVQSNDSQKQRKIQELQVKLAEKKTEKNNISQQINNSLNNINSQKNTLRSSINSMLDDNTASIDITDKPVDLQGYKDEILNLDNDFNNKVNSGNTFNLADSSNIIADETQLLNNLTKDYLDDKVTNIPPEQDTEDLSRLDKLTKPNQVIKYLRNQIKNHGNKLPKEVTQLETKIDNSINKTTNKLNKVISDLEKIKNKYNLSFSTSNFKTQAVDSSSFSNVSNLQSNIANTINSLTESASESQEATDKINPLISETNSTNSEFNNTINSSYSSCNQQSTTIIAALPPANTNCKTLSGLCHCYKEPETQPVFPAYPGIGGFKDDWRILTVYDDRKGPDLSFVIVPMKGALENEEYINLRDNGNFVGQAGGIKIEKGNTKIIDPPKSCVSGINGDCFTSISRKDGGEGNNNTFRTGFPFGQSTDIEKEIFTSLNEYYNRLPTQKYKNDFAYFVVSLDLDDLWNDYMCNNKKGSETISIKMTPDLPPIQFKINLDTKNNLWKITK